MTVPILSTKLFVPPLRSSLVSRPRLIDRLQSDSTTKLTLLSAPAGYGKTSLLSEWIASCGSPFGWLSLDHQDNDFGRFWTYIIAALKSIPLEVDAQISSFLQSRQADKFEGFLISVINQISLENQPFSLVLDDYHLIQNQEIHDTLYYFIDNLPPKTHLVIATRTDPPLRLAQLRARGQLCEIRAGDLRFTNEETLHFLNDRLGLGLSTHDVTALSEKTEGWIAGLQLAAISLQGHQDKPGFIRAFAGDDRYIADYLLDEALNRQAEHIQRFLLQTSILNLFTASLCDAVTGRSDSPEILAELVQANLFLVPLDDKGGWYRYHHLFADLLRKRHNQTPAKSKQQLYQRASSWFEQNQLLSEAVRLSLLSGDTERVARLMEGYLLTIVSTSELAELNHLLRSLPEKEIAGDPWLALSLAWGLAYEGELESAQTLLEKAVDRIKDSNEFTWGRLKGRISVLRAYLAGTEADYPRSIQFAHDALRDVPENDLSIRSFTILIIGNAFRFQGKLLDAVHYHKEALNLSEKAGDTLLSVMILSRLVDLYRITGQMNLAYKTGRDALRMVENHQEATGVTTFVEGYLKLRLSKVYYEGNQLGAALKFTKTGFALARQWGAYDSLSLGYFNFCKIYQALGDSQKAGKYLREFIEGYPFEDRFQHRTALAFEAELAVHKGDIQSANNWVQSSGLKVGDDIRFLQFQFYDVLAQVLIMRKQISEAYALLDRLLRIAVESGAVEHEIRTRSRMALIYHQEGDKKTALEILTPALDLAAAGEYVRIFLDQGESMAQLLYFAALNGVHVDYCGRILEKYQLKSPTHINDDRDLIDPLSAREIEVLGLIALGYTNQEIAQELVLSLFTIKSHARNIYSKLGVKNRTEAVAKARLLGMLSKS